MSTVTIAVDLAKNVFELAITGRTGAIRDRKRLSRSQFERFWGSVQPCRVVMEACSSSHFWGRLLLRRGFDVVLLPPQYVRPYRRRSKTDGSDCEALLEAVRCAGIHPVAVKSEDQQALVALHRVRSQWIASRTARINTIRGLLREFGIAAPVGAPSFLKNLLALLTEKQDKLPKRVSRTAMLLWEEIHDLKQRIKSINDELARIGREEPVVRSLLAIPGIGILTRISRSVTCKPGR